MCFKLIAGFLLLGLAGCGTLPRGGSLASDSSGSEIKPLIPNWQVEESRIASDRFRISLRRKLFAGGGDGEAAQVFNRRAEQLARDHGHAGYTILEFSEGIESTLLPVAQRVSSGVIRLR